MKSQNPITTSQPQGTPALAVGSSVKIALWGLSGICLILAATFAFSHATKSPTLPPAGRSGDEAAAAPPRGAAAEQAKAPGGGLPPGEQDPPVSSLSTDQQMEPIKTKRMRIPPRDESLPWRNRPGFTVFAYNIELVSIIVMDNALVLGGQMRIEIDHLQSLSTQEKARLA